LFGFINFLANLGAITFIITFGSFKDMFGSVTGGFLVIALISLIALLIGRPVLQKEVAEE
jgi:hypothetical protein